MKELDENIGKIYHENGYYYLEKIYDSLVELMGEEPRVKKRAKRHGFKIIKSHWHLGENPFYNVETILNADKKKYIDKSRYIYKMKLKYVK
tara:strand:+ start:361 stop:633 length:273 start_codon:yes stop_codon:yes gene_type:complete